MSAAPRASGRQAVHGMAWTSGGYAVQAVAQFVVLALLARFLTPVEFGLASGALVVISLARIVTDSLVGPAITQKPDLTDEHVRTAFVLAVAAGIVGMAALWVGADLAARLFAIDGLGPVLRGLSPILVVDALSTVPIALLQRDLAFRRLAQAEALSYVFGYALVGCVLAVAGTGVWALVAAQLAYAAVRSGLTLAWRPHPRGLVPDRVAAAEVLRYGAGHTLGKSANQVALQGDYFVVGRWLSVGALGVYGRAYQLAVKPAMLLGQALDKVLFPVMAALQDDRARLAETYRRSVSLAASVSGPMAIMGVVLGPEIVAVVLGSQWDAAVLPFQVLAAGLVARTAYKPSDSLVRASGRVYRRAWRQFVYAGLVVLGAWVGTFWGLGAVAASVAVAILVNALLMAHLSLDIVGMRWSGWLGAHGRGLALAGLVGAVAVPSTAWLRATGAGSLVVLVGVSALVVVVVGMLAVVAPRTVLGPDVQWLLSRVRRRRSGPGRPAPRRGAIVAVLGADGSGKSTLTARLGGDLADVLPGTPVEWLYLGSGDGPAAWYRRPMKAVRDRLDPPSTRKGVPGPAGARSSGLRATLRTSLRTAWACTLAAEKVGKTRHADRARRRGAIVVCDRYPQTQCPGGNDGPLLDHWSASASGVLRAVARWEWRAYERALQVLPDLVLKLDVPVEVAHGRRPGLDPEYLRARVHLVRALDLGCPTVVLDASAPPDRVHSAAVAAIREVVTVA
ncbi:oligosaccharide flippase family protein [Salsipaludibacter albus]|uniref:oligosaccharide flippase family protein n=1 Tax=Salsipaludibacter albus TaxID=2849650 RepID=UPI001EE3B1FA|nr:oligosaccharide flippase family protein [Salsipaludibacter albus]MBY5161755.1 oligosaccharide flippase family protein [Salsipaludibacter albus]